jgi:hypothetical protein
MVFDLPLSAMAKVLVLWYNLRELSEQTSVGMPVFLSESSRVLADQIQAKLQAEIALGRRSSAKWQTKYIPMSGGRFLLAAMLTKQLNLKT